MYNLTKILLFQINAISFIFIFIKESSFYKNIKR